MKFREVFWNYFIGVSVYAIYLCYILSQMYYMCLCVRVCVCSLLSWGTCPSTFFCVTWDLQVRCSHTRYCIPALRTSLLSVSEFSIWEPSSCAALGKFMRNKVKHRWAFPGTQTSASWTELHWAAVLWIDISNWTTLGSWAVNCCWLAYLL